MVCNFKVELLSELGEIGVWVKVLRYIIGFLGNSQLVLGVIRKLKGILLKKVVYIFLFLMYCFLSFFFFVLNFV